jgi:hypothetical protein
MSSFSLRKECFGECWTESKTLRRHRVFLLKRADRNHKMNVKCSVFVAIGNKIFRVSREMYYMQKWGVFSLNLLAGVIKDLGF